MAGHDWSLAVAYLGPFNLVLYLFVEDSLLVRA